MNRSYATATYTEEYILVMPKVKRRLDIQPQLVSRKHPARLHCFYISYTT